MPMTCVLVFSRSKTICPKTVVSGATSVTDGARTGSRRACESSSVRLAALPCAPENPNWFVAPACTKRRLVPNDWIREVMDSCAPRPMAVNEMTAVTPMMMPSSVSP